MKKGGFCGNVGEGMGGLGQILDGKVVFIPERRVVLTRGSTGFGFIAAERA